MCSKILKLYQELFDLVKPEEKDELSIFVGKKGRHYDASPLKLMLIGRATNGWDKLGQITKDEFTKTVKDLCLCQDGFGDVYGDNEDLHFIDKEDGHITTLTYPFWEYTHEFYEKFVGMNFHGAKRWIDYIYWTNLHKIAPADPFKYGSPNPKPELQFRQMPIIRDILKEEIEGVRPTHILLVVGYDWFAEFNEGVFQNIKKLGRNINGGKNKNNQYVEWKAHYQLSDGTLIPVVSVCRPEFRNKDCYVADVLKAWDE